VTSPGGAIEMSISTDNGKLVYSVADRGKPVIVKSGMALDIQDQPLLGPNVKIVGTRAGAVDETYTMLHGKSNPVRNAARTLAAGRGAEVTIELTNGQH